MSFALIRTHGNELSLCTATIIKSVCLTLSLSIGQHIFLNDEKRAFAYKLHRFPRKERKMLKKVKSKKKKQKKKIKPTLKHIGRREKERSYLYRIS